MYVTMVFHHARAEHRDAMLRFMHTIEAAMEGTPGLVSLESYRDLDADRLVAIGRDPAWTDRPDELFRLEG